MEQPRQPGLYVPSMEKDSCGTGLIANLNGIKSHELIENALTMLSNMEHRGACGCEPNTGDGAGIMIQTPHDFFVKKSKELGFGLPEEGKYGVGMLFFPQDRNLRNQCRTLFNDYIDETGFDLLGYRKVPTDHEELGDMAISVEPRMEQVFVKPKAKLEKYDLERRLYLLRKYATHKIYQTFPQSVEQFYIASFSYKTILYKGQLTTHQLRPYFQDLHDDSVKSAMALIHSRFSTNTVPKWKLAQPFRYIAHNGEINTITGNNNWWKSKEQVMKSAVFTADELEKLFPVCGTSLSDSANFDNVLEFLVMNGRSLPHALMMMIPEAWQHDAEMSEDKKAFYEYHEMLMEPWDGPAAICFSDGIVVGATLDRNGLRPLRYLVTDDNVLIAASEAGALPVDPAKIVFKGRLQPGRMLVADLEERRMYGDEEVKNIICHNREYKDWIKKYRLSLDDVSKGINDADGAAFTRITEKNLLERQQLFGTTREDLSVILEPMLKSGEEPIGSMGTDVPLAVLSQQSQHLSNYFKQLFAQVTNPPIDPIREKDVMSLHVKLGSCGNILIPTEEQAKFIFLEQPVLRNGDLLKLKRINHPNFRSETVEITFDADGQKGRLKHALEEICARAEEAVRNGANLLVLSDASADMLNAPVPTLLATGAVHHHLIREGLRSACSIIVEGGDIRETHHIATLLGYGANAVNPYLAFETVKSIALEHELTSDAHLNGANGSAGYSVDKKAKEYFIKAINKGLLKVMSKIGISTLQSYCGAQIFEALGIHSDVVNTCFTKTVSRIEGIGYDTIAEEVLIRLRLAYYNSNPGAHKQLETGGIYQWKRRGEYHMMNPNTIHLLQVSSRTNDYGVYKKYAELINRQTEQACTLRGLLTFRKGTPIPIEEVEPVENILRRFATGAMSFGSISHEAHSTLAIAMNRIGGKSNSGEGGEDPIRFERKANGDWERSAIKQVASGRFGVTSYYLSNADELQIKMAQGAKPGEGGQLPGHKVDDWIGRVRHSTPGVGLISPPPHHDIYSIEDLAQLIFDLKNANRAARINVKLVSKAGVGIIASGVAKAKADAILISGHDGGTGASPVSSIRHTGLPWELGVAETHQTLVKNKLRDRVTIQTDGMLRTGRDLAIAALLGAEEWGVATGALIVEGCIMMRKCHLNTCPVGVATQDPELRKRFTGDPQHVVNFFTFLANDLREIMAELGYSTVNEMVGKVEMLKARKDVDHWKYKHVDLSPILYKEPAEETIGQYKKVAQDHGIDHILDLKLIKYAQRTLDTGNEFAGQFDILNTDRAVGTMLSNEISKRYKGEGLRPDTLSYRFRGSAGQSFGAFAARGVKFTLEGESNDYFGKGLSGAKLIVVPDRKATFDPAKNIIIGNVALYGATSGEAYIRGMAGERFAVRNSGANAVVEGVGDHGCEYMTGGIVAVLGETGKNFGAGMSGGMAYVYNANGQFHKKFNPDMADIEPLSVEDQDILRKMIRQHFNYTASQLALDLLTRWEEILPSFVKIMPRDYKAVLEKRNEAAKQKEAVAV